MSIIKFTLLAVVATVLLILLSFWLGAWNISREEAEQKYTTENSHFITVDGVRLHYRDEGQGTVIVLLHGQFASLQQWDGWARELTTKYRVIRLDTPPFGLSPFDPSGEYSAVRSLALVEAFIDQLGLKDFVLGGTSLGSGLAVGYAARHPENVHALLLSTLPAIYSERRARNSTISALRWVSENVVRTKYLKSYWRYQLETIFGDPSKVTDELVTRYDELNSQRGQSHAIQAQMVANRLLAKNNTLPQDLAKLQAPVLLQWAGKSPVLPEQLAAEIQAMVSSPVTLIQYAELGHKLTIEDPRRTVVDAMKFLASLPPRPAEAITSPPASP